MWHGIHPDGAGFGPRRRLSGLSPHLRARGAGVCGATSAETSILFSISLSLYSILFIACLERTAAAGTSAVTVSGESIEYDANCGRGGRGSGVALGLRHGCRYTKLGAVGVRTFSTEDHIMS